MFWLILLIIVGVMLVITIVVLVIWGVALICNAVDLDDMRDNCGY